MSKPADASAEPKIQTVYRLGVTGSIGSGKSAVGKQLEELGIEVIDTDVLAHQLLKSPNEAYDQVLARFGADLVDAPGGPIDRKKLGAIVFKDAKARADLEAIVHPAIEKATDAAVAACKGDVVAVQIPLLFEVGREKKYDEIWCVVVNRKVQLDRLMKRDGLTLEQAEARIAAMWTQDEKVRRTLEVGGRVIDNSGTLEETKAQTAKALDEAKARAKAKREGTTGTTTPPASTTDGAATPVDTTKAVDTTAAPVDTTTAPAVDNAARNAEYRSVLTKLSGMGTEAALERMGDVSTTEHKEATASLSLTVDSCEGDHKGPNHVDTAKELKVDVHMSVRNKPGTPPVPPTNCSCGCGDKCKKGCACAAGCGCTCTPGTPPPPKPPTKPTPGNCDHNHGRPLLGLFGLLAFLFAVLALVYFWHHKPADHTGDHDSITIIVNPPSCDSGCNPPVTPPNPPVKPPLPPIEEKPACPQAGDQTLFVTPDFAAPWLHNEVRQRVVEWKVRYQPDCQGATLIGRDYEGRLVVWQEYGPKFSFVYQWTVKYTGDVTQVDRFEASNNFVGRSLYHHNKLGFVVRVDQLDGNQRMLASASLNRDVNGVIYGMTMNKYDQVTGRLLDTASFDNYSRIKEIMRAQYFLFGVFGQMK